MPFFDVSHDLVSSSTGAEVAVKRTQHIPAEFLDHLADNRLASSHTRTREYHEVASVPVAVVELWMRQGIDFYRMTSREIVQKLRKDGLDAFIATSKEV